jgi:hypothetical protein
VNKSRQRWPDTHLRTYPTVKIPACLVCFFFFIWLFVLLRMQSGTRNRLRQSVIGRHRKFATAEFEERGNVTGYSTEIVQAVLQEAGWQPR